MMTYESMMAAQQAAHQAFGAMLRSWRIQNKWTQYTAHNWAKEAGFETISYGNLSVIEQGKAGELRQKAFFQLEELNRRLIARNWGNVKTQKIKEKLKDAKPLVDDNGKAWDAVDFWACYVGMKPIPANFGGGTDDSGSGD
jgi:transcriptional regulator with XRE-family HTH domain